MSPQSLSAAILNLDFTVSFVFGGFDLGSSRIKRAKLKTSLVAADCVEDVKVVGLDVPLVLVDGKLVNIELVGKDGLLVEVDVVTVRLVLAGLLVEVEVVDVVVGLEVLGL